MSPDAAPGDVAGPAAIAPPAATEPSVEEGRDTPAPDDVAGSPEPGLEAPTGEFPPVNPDCHLAGRIPLDL